ncbi:MAG: hypothetical protein ISN28_01220, partial [Ectothiorhodospiraceae bacterium AqS1]|nr:hypothetical protein [Ectothiorhodospiraceae bacterium AqS1]
MDDTGTLAIDEGDTGTFTIKFGATPKPVSNVTVTITSADTGAVTVNPASLTFTTTNHTTEQTVTVTGVEDDNDNNDESVDLTISATGGLKADDLTKTVTVDDKEATPVMVVEGGSAALEVNEEGTATFTVKIDPPSTGSVEITLTSDNDDLTITPATLDFDAGDADEQTVTVSAAKDSDNRNESATIELDADGITVADAVKQISIRDNDTPSGNMVLDNTAQLIVGEGGTGTFSVRLSIEPNDEVTVNVSSDDTGSATVNPASLTFNATNWSTAQTVTVIGAQDIDVADETPLITLSATGGIVASDVEKRVAVRDDDSPGTLFMLPSPLQVVEGGQEIFLVRLGTVPTVSSVAVNLTLSGNNPSVSLNPTSLTFTDVDWNTNQVVTVSVEEDDNADNGADTITGSYSSGTGNYASAANPEGATISLITLDRPGDIVTSTQMLDLLEGGDAVEFTVRLGEVPINTNTVTLTLTNSNRDVTISPKVLLFTRDNWSEERTVSAQAGEDSDKEDGYDIIVIKGAGGNYSRSESRVS